jgi:mono/diheme cytochrome c family protein
MKKLSFSLALSLLLLGSGVALADAPSGADVWAKKCKTCHGADGTVTKVGEKKGAPAHLYEKTEKMTVEDAIKAVTNGGEKMPAFKDKLTEAEIKAVSEYSLTLKPAAPAAPAE